MKNIFKYLIVFVTYNVLGGILWYNQELLMPIFIAIYILINLFVIDKASSFLGNFISISGLMIISEIVVLIMSNFNKPIAIQYIGLMLIISFIIYYLKTHYSQLNSYSQ